MIKLALGNLELSKNTKFKQVQMIGNQIIHLKSIESTNNYANCQISENDYVEGTVFLAYEQTSGKGQRNNFWESEPGKNLTFSIILYPDFLKIRQQFMLSKVVSLGIHKALSKYVGDLKIKWPNDIYSGNLKLGGILIENSIMYGLIKSSVVGIGLNVNQTIFKSAAPNPVSLKTLTNQHFNCDNLLEEILVAIDEYYSILIDDQYESIDSQFLSTLYRLNDWQLFKAEQEIFEGEIIGVNEIGQLLIRNREGKVFDFHFKEVEFI